jgi:hypothetical protein
MFVWNDDINTQTYTASKPRSIWCEQYPVWNPVNVYWQQWNLPYFRCRFIFPTSLFITFCWRCIWGRVCHREFRTLVWVAMAVPGPRWRAQGCVWAQVRAPHRGTSASTASESKQWQSWWKFWEPHVKIQNLWSWSLMSSIGVWCLVVVRIDQRHASLICVLLLRILHVI